MPPFPWRHMLLLWGPIDRPIGWSPKKKEVLYMYCACRCTNYWPWGSGNGCGGSSNAGSCGCGSNTSSSGCGCGNTAADWPVTFPLNESFYPFFYGGTACGNTVTNTAASCGGAAASTAPVYISYPMRGGCCR